MSSRVYLHLTMQTSATTLYTYAIRYTHMPFRKEAQNSFPKCIFSLNKLKCLYKFDDIELRTWQYSNSLSVNIYKMWVMRLEFIPYSTYSSSLSNFISVFYKMYIHKTDGSAVNPRKCLMNNNDST